jgi:hypothetical protein
MKTRPATNLRSTALAINPAPTANTSATAMVTAAKNVKRALQRATFCIKLAKLSYNLTFTVQKR